MVKLFSNHCPTKDKVVTISVDYINASAYEDTQRHLIKGRFSCEYSQLCDSCNNCTLYQNAPEQINL